MIDLNNFEIETVIYRTKEYDIFKFNKLNREVNRRNVDRIKKSMGRKYITVPIIVNKEFEIGDGQHRYVAEKELGLPIRFIVVENLDMTDIQDLNNNQMIWTAENYLDSYIEANDENYINFKLVKEEYNINYSDMLFIIDELSENRVGENQMSVDFKDGLLGFNNIDKVITFLEDLKLFKQFIFYNDTRFVRAFFKLYVSEFYDREFLEERIVQSQELFIQRGKQIDIINYGKLLAKAYTYPRKGMVITYNEYNNSFEQVSQREKRREL